MDADHLGPSMQSVRLSSGLLRGAFRALERRLSNGRRAAILRKTLQHCRVDAGRHAVGQI